jgi:hypothetical protein
MCVNGSMLAVPLRREDCSDQIVISVYVPNFVRPHVVLDFHPGRSNPIVEVTLHKSSDFPVMISWEIQDHAEAIF